VAEILGISKLESVLSAKKNSLAGCLVDTSILFALSYPLDLFNEDAETAFNILAKQSIPVFSNVNVRTEFIELHRRVAIPEGLIDLLQDAEASLDLELAQQLKSLRTRYRNAQAEDKSFLLSDKEIKKYRRLLIKYQGDGKDGWEQFCEDYLIGIIQQEWAITEDQWNLNFFTLRSNEKHPLIISDVTWEDMVQLVERFGLGSMDAMILNLFNCSTLGILLTADSDLAYAAQKLNMSGKYVFVPDTLVN